MEVAVAVPRRLTRILTGYDRADHDDSESSAPERHRRVEYATTLYMNQTVGIAELRQNLSVYLRRVAQGERLLVTDHNRPVAELGPPPSTGPALDRLIAEGRISAPARRTLPGPLQMDGDAYALSRALDEIRGER
jgi:prevent-host-death family protein